MKPMVCLFLLLNLFGCATKPTIHLYGRYLTEISVIKIKNKLEESGFDVEVNQLAFPNNVQQSTILYSPLLENKEAISTVTNQLSSLNYSIHHNQPLVSGKHFYTKNNLGLFILPEGETAKKRTLDIANEYKSTECDQSISLSLNNDGTYQITFAQLPFPEETDYLKGVWRITQFPYISLGPKDDFEWFYFEVREEQETDRIGLIQKTLLVPQDKYAYLHFCDFAYGQRQ